MTNQPFDFNALVQFKLLRKDSVLPTRGTVFSGAFDIYAPEAGVLYPGEKKIIPSGLAHQLHDGYKIPMRVECFEGEGVSRVSAWKEILVPFQLQGMLISRSGLAAKKNVRLYFAPCLIDHDYRGEIMLVMENTDHAHSAKSEVSAIRWDTGDRLCQIAYVPCYMGPCQETQQLNDTDRGHGGLGSTGMPQ